MTQEARMGAARDTYMRFVGQVAANLVDLGIGTEPDNALAEAAIEAVRRTANLTSGGVELTDELIDRLAAEAEAGYDVDQLVPRRDCSG